LRAGEQMTVPDILRREMSTSTAQTDPIEHSMLDFVRATFTPIERSRSTVGLSKTPTLKALGQGIRFINRLRRQGSSSMQELPFEVEDRDVAIQVSQSLALTVLWDYDITSLRELTGGKELQTLGYHCMMAHGIVEHFGIEKAVLKHWLATMESLYKDKPYHSKTHAADVLQGVHFFLTTGGAAKFLSKLETFALLVAAIIHDVGHDGLTNSFHRTTMSSRAITFNDQSIQENFHLSTFFGHTLNNPELDIFKTLPKDQILTIRGLIVDAVLETDMTKHFASISTFRTMVSKKGQSVEEWSNSSNRILNFLLHMADTSNPARPLGTAKMWANAVLEEWFQQGDRERQLGLPVSPQCCRDNTVLSATQVGFIKFVVLPQFQMASELLPEVKEHCLPTLLANLNYWQALQDQAKQQETTSRTTSCEEGMRLGRRHSSHALGGHRRPSHHTLGDRQPPPCLSSSASAPSLGLSTPALGSWASAPTLGPSVSTQTPSSPFSTVNPEAMSAAQILGLED